MADTQYCENMGCYVTEYKLHGFDIIKLHDDNGKPALGYMIYLPNGGPMVHMVDCYWQMLEWTREHQKEIA